MTHGHELKRGLLEEMEGTGQRGQREKNWENCNSIINEMYLLKKLQYIYTMVYYTAIKKKEILPSATAYR